MVHKHGLNRGGRGVHSPSTICGKPSPARAAGLSGLTSRLKLEGKLLDMEEEVVTSKVVAAPARRRRFDLSLTVLSLRFDYAHRPERQSNGSKGGFVIA